MNRGLKVTHQWVWVILIAYFFLGIIIPVVGLLALICMVAPFATAFFAGRKWCGNFCPRGSFIDEVLAKFSLKKPAPALFKQVWFKLTFLTLLMGAFSIQIYYSWGNTQALGYVFIRMIVITTVLTIILGWIYQPRTWCLICPMGTLAHFVAKSEGVKSRIRHITFNIEKCTGCRICSKHCPVEIQVHQYRDQGRVVDADCIKCATCIDKCPKKSLKIA